MQFCSILSRLLNYMIKLDPDQKKQNCFVNKHIASHSFPIIILNGFKSIHLRWSPLVCLILYLVLFHINIWFGNIMGVGHRRFVPLARKAWVIVCAFVGQIRRKKQKCCPRNYLHDNDKKSHANRVCQVEKSVFKFAMKSDLSLSQG